VPIVTLRLTHLVPAPVKSAVKLAIVRLFGEARLLDLQMRRGAMGKNDYYDELTVLVMKRVLQPASVCLDIGCHAGDLLAEMMGFAPQGRFLAFEPLPDFYQRIVGRFTAGQVKIFQCALSSEEGVTPFKWVKTNPGYSGIRERRYDRPDEVIEEIVVSMRKLDSIIAEERLASLNFVKIDVEGAEMLVLRGGIESLRRFKPVVVFEHGRGGAEYYSTKPEAIYDLLVTECGLRCSTLLRFLTGRPPLSRDDFAAAYRSGQDYYWIAYP
jgi:FkbM family methyltransferase